MADVVFDQVKCLLRRTVQRDILGKTLVDVGIDRFARIGRADAPSRILLRPAKFASRAAGDRVRFVDERVLVSCFNVKDLLLEGADDTLQLSEK